MSQPSVVGSHSSFVIDAASLASASKKPHHLEKRKMMVMQIPYHLKHSKRSILRSAFLDARRKACSERVLKAKNIAQKHAQLQSNAESAKREILKQKLQVSEARRLSLLKVPRSKYMDPNVLDQIDMEVKKVEACIRIQSWWRFTKLHRNVVHFDKHRLSMSTASIIPFPKLVKMTQSEALAKIVGRFLVRAKRMSFDPVENWKAPTKVFMSAYLIVGHTEHILPQIGDLEKNLIESARKFLIDFEVWIHGPKSQITANGYAFLLSWISFYTTFNSWKSADTDKLIMDLIHHFMDLEKLWISVKAQEDADGEWKPSLGEQQRQIHGKLHRMGPEAIEKLFNERTKFMNEYLIGEPEAITRPITYTNTSTDVYKSSFPERRDSVTSNRNTPEPTSETTKPPASQIAGWNQLMSNQKLAHELIMDPNFEMKRADENTLEGQITKIAKQAFFDSMNQEFEKGNFKNHVPGLLEDIRNALVIMLPEKSKVGEQIKEVLDMELIVQQLDKNSFDIPQCLHFIVSKMLQLCAPIRDAVIRDIANETHLAKAFERILDVLEDMKLDLMNFQLQSVKPYLMQQAAEYEKTKFNEALERNQVQLDRTKEWLKKSVVDLQSVTAARNPENITHPDLRVKFESVYNSALLGLLFSNTPIEQDSLAETLLLDFERICSLQNEAQAIAIVSALVMLSKNIVPELRRNDTASKKLKESLFILLEHKETSIDNLALQIISTINECLSEKKVSVEQESIIKSMVEKTVSFTDPVYSLICRRMQTNVMNELEKGVFRKESLASHGLDTVSNELENLSKKIHLLAKHNKDVYVQHYDLILNSLI